MSRPDSQDSELRMGGLIDEFTRRLRAGEQPDIEHYAARLPQHGQELRDVLETVIQLDHEADCTPLGESPAQPPKQLGPYRIEREIGRGGMGVVLLAYDEELSRRVALKLLPVQATLDARFLERFRREARAAGRLQHPGIVPVFGVGEHEQIHYYAMEYVEGCSLDRVIEVLDPSDSSRPLPTDSGSVTELARNILNRPLDRPLPPTGSGFAWRRGYAENIVALVVQVTEAVSFAHSHGILHRDIKPANLLLDHAGRLRLTDFGLCRNEGDPELTQSKDLVGTLRYMAPEQIQGTTDVRSDVYGLGVTLYELLALRPAFPGRQRASLIQDILQRPLDKLPSGTPRDLQAIVFKATAKQPEDRYGTAQAMGQDLRAFLEGRPISARRPSLLRSLELLARRNRALVVTSLLFLVTLTVASSAYVRSMLVKESARQAEKYRASIAAAAANVDPDPALVRSFLDSAPEALRAWEWDHLAALSDQSLEIVIDRQDSEQSDINEQWLYSMASSPDGRWLAVGRGSGVQLFELGGARDWHLRVDKHPELLGLYFDAQSTHVVALGVNSAKCWQLTDPPKLRATASNRHRPIGLHPQSREILVCDPAGRIFELDLDLQLRQVANAPEALVQLECSRDGSTTLGLSSEGDLYLDPLGEQPVHYAMPEPATRLGLSPDGRYLVAGTLSGNVWVWDRPVDRAGFGDRPTLWSKHSQRVDAIAFHPDENVFASGARDGHIHLWDPSAGLRGTLRGATHWVEHIEWVSRHQLLAGTLDGVVRRWDLAASGGLLALWGHHADIWNLQLSHSNRWLLTSSRDGTIRLWDRTTGALQRVLYHDGLHGPEARFSLDEEQVYCLGNEGYLWTLDLASGSVVARDLVLLADGSPAARPNSLRVHPGGQELYVQDEASGTLVRLRQDAAGHWASTGWLAADSYRFDLCPTGTALFVGTADGRLRRVDLASFEVVEETQAHKQRVAWVVARDKNVYTTGDQGVRIWRRRSLAPVAYLHNGPYLWLAGLGVSQDETRLVCSFEDQLNVWDIQQQALLIKLAGPGRGYSVVDFSRDGRAIAAGSWDGVARIWDTTTAQQRGAALDVQRSAEDREVQRVLDLQAQTGDWERTRELLAEDMDRPGTEAALALAHRESGTFEALLQRVLRLLRSPDSGPEQWKAAHSLTHGLHKERAHDPLMNVLLGECWLRRGLFGPALRVLEPLAQAGSQVRGQALCLLALMHARQQDGPAALQAFAQAVATGQLQDAQQVQLLRETRAALAPFRAGWDE